MPGVFRWKTCSKEGTLVILYDLSANALTEKCLKSPKSAENETNNGCTGWKVFKQRDYVRLCIGSISAKVSESPEKCRM